MRRLLAGIALLMLLPLPAWAGPFDGTWRVDFKNAHFDSKPWEQTLDNGRYSCTTCDPKIDIKADASAQPVATNGGQPATLAVMVLDARSVRFTHTRNGKLTLERVQTVSADGKTLTVQRTEYPPSGPPVRITVSHTRIGTAPFGAHAISGVWRMAKYDMQSDHGQLFTLQSTANGLAMSSPTGKGYVATLDGPAVAVHGDPDEGTVAIKKIDANSFEETYTLKDKPVSITRYSVRGNAMTIAEHDLKRNSRATLTAERVTTASH